MHACSHSCGKTKKNKEINTFTNAHNRQTYTDTHGALSHIHTAHSHAYTHIHHTYTPPRRAVNTGLAHVYNKANSILLTLLVPEEVVQHLVCNPASVNYATSGSIHNTYYYLVPKIQNQTVLVSLRVAGLEGALLEPYPSLVWRYRPFA